MASQHLFSRKSAHRPRFSGRADSVDHWLRRRRPATPCRSCPASSVVLTRHDLADTGFAKARKRAEAKVDIDRVGPQREIPNIRAFALRRWHDAEHVCARHPDDRTADRGRASRLLGLGACGTTADHRAASRRSQRTDHPGHPETTPARRQIYYLLHIKPSKYDRARVIPIGDGLGQVIAEIIGHIQGFYGPTTSRLRPPRRRTRSLAPGAPYLLQGVGHPSAISSRRFVAACRAFRLAAGARHADGAGLR